MANQEDYLDKVWIKVINLDPNGSWIEECISQSSGPFSSSGPALFRILASKPSPQDLGRVYRFVRYHACSLGLRSLERPGLKTGKLRGLHRELHASKASKSKSLLSEVTFIKALWQVIHPEDQGAWIEDLPRSMPGGAFGDVPAALKRLLKKKITARDLGAVAPWHRYDALFDTFRLMEEEGFRKASEIPGLHEILLGLEPSGKEARRGSWPFLRILG
jgi:hypothetical protein